MVVDIRSVNIGRNQSWLEFICFVGTIDRNRAFTIEFWGTELNTSFYLSESNQEALRDMLVEDFGYSPYNISEAEAQLGQSKIYVIRY